MFGSVGEAGFYLRALGRLAEAAQPMQAALEAMIAGENWKNAAIAAENLSELHLTIGDLTRSVDYAERGVEFADISKEPSERRDNRATLADALHQAGRLGEAESLLREAETMQKEQQPGYPLLYSFRGYRYCDLLLGQGKVEEVQRRASQTLECAEQHLGLFDVALDLLSLGRAHLLQAQHESTGDYTQAVTHLDQAVDGLRAAGHQELIVRGLLSRAALRRAMGEFAGRGPTWTRRRSSPSAAACACTRPTATWSTPGCTWRWARETRPASTWTRPGP